MSRSSHLYSAHHAYVRPAWQARQLWRVALMLLGVEAVFWTAPYILVAFLPGEAADSYNEATTAFGTLAQFFTFAISGAGFLFLLRLLHGRGFWSLVGPRHDALRDFLRVTIGVGAILLVIRLLPPWINPAELAEIRHLGQWLILIPVALVALLIQVGTEEMIFRGYLQQQLACVSQNRLVWMGLPSAIFGALHYWNGIGPAEGVIIAIWAGLLGLACADLTARSGNLGAAVGLHLANNAFALLIVGVMGWPTTGLALFLYPYEDPALYDFPLRALQEPWAILQLLILTGTVLVVWLAARIAIRR